MKYEIHIGKSVRKLLKNQGVSPAELGERIGKGRTTVYAMLRQKYLHSGLMVKISEALKHDIIQYLYQPDELPSNKKLLQKVEELEHQIETLRQENNYLKELNQLLKQKR